MIRIQINRYANFQIGFHFNLYIKTPPKIHMSATKSLKSLPKNSFKKPVQQSHKRKKTLGFSYQKGTIRKIRHTNQTTFEQTQKTNKYINEDTMSSLVTQKISLSNQEKMIEEQQRKGIFQNQSLKQKYSCLLPQYMKIKYDENHQILLEIANEIEKKLASLLALQKQPVISFDQVQNHFKNLDKNVNLNHLKQINFLIQNFYVFSQDENKSITIGYNGLHTNYIWRISLFKSTLYQYLKKRDAITNEKSYPMIIPYKSLPWQTKNPNLPLLSQSSIFDTKTTQKKKSAYDLQQKLLQGINNKQKVYEQMNEDNMVSIYQFNKEILEHLITEINEYYTIKNVSNIFEVTLLEVLHIDGQNSDKCKIKAGLKQLCNFLTEKDLYYIKYKQVNGRTIIQIDRSKYESALQELSKTY